MIYTKLKKGLFLGEDGNHYENDGNGNMNMVVEAPHRVLPHPEPTTNYTQRSNGYYWVNMNDTCDWLIVEWHDGEWIDCDVELINFIDPHKITRSSYWNPEDMLPG